MAYYEGEINPMTSGNCNNGWGDWSWIIGLALVGGLFGGWGNGGFGFGGGRGYGAAPATQADLAAGFANSEIMSDLNTIISSLTQGFAGLNTAIANSTSTLGFNMAEGFHGVDNAICTLGYNTQAGFNALANQMASCCCDLKTMNLENRYLNAQQTTEIVAAINAGNQRLVDIYTNDKMEALRAENVALKGQISNDRQSAYITDTILDRLSPCPKPAYLTCNPNAPYGFGYGVPYGYGVGCGCGASVQ